MSHADSYMRVLINNQMKALMSGHIKQAAVLGNHMRNRDKKHGTLLTQQPLNVYMANFEVADEVQVTFNQTIAQIFTSQNKKEQWKIYSLPYQ